MKAVSVSLSNVADYIDYCRHHGAEHDESFLPDDEFVPTADYPAYLLRAGGDVLGAVGLVCTRPYREKAKGRLTIFHSVTPSPAAYAAMLSAIQQQANGLGSVFGFLPKASVASRACWESLGFEVERYAYLMSYRSYEIPSLGVPEGYSLKALDKTDEQGVRALCDVWNRSYGQQPGFVGATPERIAESFDAKEHIPGGLLLLRRGTTPIGTAHICRDDVAPTSADVGMLSVHPDHRGQGLGRLMLRASVAVALQAGLLPVYLSVNAANAAAVGLYASEGFVEDKAMVCYALTFGAPGTGTF